MRVGMDAIEQVEDDPGGEAGIRRWCAYGAVDTAYEEQYVAQHHSGPPSRVSGGRPGEIRRRGYAAHWNQPLVCQYWCLKLLGRRCRFKTTSGRQFSADHVPWWSGSERRIVRKWRCHAT
jgi:hypothetical protein